jgi:hypothetical protein
LPLPTAGESQKQGAAMAMAIAKVLSLRGKWDFVVFFFLIIIIIIIFYSGI